MASQDFSLIETEAGALPIHLATPETFEAVRDGLETTARAWLQASGYQPRPGALAMLPDSAGGLAGAVFGPLPEDELGTGAALRQALPGGQSYRLEGTVSGVDAIALGWAIGGPRYSRKSQAGEAADPPRLVWPAGCDRAAIAAQAAADLLTKRLVDTPAEDMTPQALAAETRAIAARFGASVDVITGDALLDANYPAVHAVGRASVNPPCLIDLRWGQEDAPRLTLVGKGVCFDTGGLGLKPGDSMLLMKKDMGGAAHALGLAQAIMELALPLRLRLLIPAVENSVSGNAMRPLDVIVTRSGQTIEIGHTDAEGRVILADALTEAIREQPALLLDFATLTGAARVALGPDLPALFSNDDSLAATLMQAARVTRDPIWRLPLWAGYASKLSGDVADITNAPKWPFAGAITAALFLQRFVGTQQPWAHFDLYAWNPWARPGRPVGAACQTQRACLAAIRSHFDL